MHLLEGVWIALEALWANKLRSFLTLLGNIVGVMSVIAVVSIIDGMNSFIRTEVAREGTGVFSVQQVNPLDILSDFEKFMQSLHNPRITLDDLNYLRARVTLADAMDASRVSQEQARRGRLAIDGVRIHGRTENYPVLGAWDLKDGRHFTFQEVDHSTGVTVIGSDIAQRLFPSVDPIGKELKIAGIAHRVIGVLEERAGFMGGNPNLTVVLPITTFQKMFGSRGSITISVKPATLELAEACEDQTRLYMRSLRNLGPRREDNFAILTSDNLLALWEGISQGIFAALVGIVSISLVVGGIVIMNIMLVSVTERTREIGVRKAVGATRGNIMWQFLVEAVTLSSCGGVIGILVGFAAAAAVAYFSPLPYAIKLWSIGAGLAVSLAVGMFFGIYPAVQASKLDPIEALRYE
ncbi:MAG: FtsX-like permease family protein [Acidobacteria bacterium]|nr:FtsX-like permease family protein [Acidobacteriota bacterium]